MLLYLDLNCLNRPFDDQAQERIATETVAVFEILQRIHAGRDELVWSDVLDLENSHHPLADRRAEIQSWRARAAVRVHIDAIVASRARALESRGLAPLDAAHLACAEAGGSEVFLTCDDRLLQRSRRGTLALLALNPVQYLESYVHG